MQSVLGAGKKYRTMQVFGSPMGVRARRELLQKTPETKLALSGTFYLPRVHTCSLPVDGIVGSALPPILKVTKFQSLITSPPQ
jgi:hypothetical protein